MPEPFLGIDLGTSNSVAAYVVDGNPTVVHDPAGEVIHPSLVAFVHDGNIVVGQPAAEQWVDNPRNTIYSAKRLIGRRALDDEVQRLKQRVAYPIIPDTEGMAMVETSHGTHSICEISAHVLCYLKHCAEQQLGQFIHRAVITVPANFHDLQRKATKEAGEQAGFQLIRILNEPTAAALAYGFGRALQRRVAVFDFGGGTLDVTVLNIHHHVFEVLATAGDTALGGDDIDIRLAEAMASACHKAHGIDLHSDAVAMSRLRRYAEALKCRLSAEEQATLEIPDVAHNADGSPLAFSVTLSQKTFQARISDLVDRALRVFDESLRLAQVDSPSLLDDTLLVGGTTRIPAVRQRLTEFLGKPPRSDVDPMQAVAIGAAIHASTLGQDVEASDPSVGAARPILLDVTPRALGVGIVGGLCETIIPRNTMVPAEETRVFVTSADNQTAVRIPVAQGESRLLRDNVALGVLELDHLPPRPRGLVKVAVTFEINTDGILEVRAVNRDTGKAERVRILLGEASSAGEGVAAGNLVPAAS